MPDPVYLDYAATTPLRPEAREVIAKLAKTYGKTPAQVMLRWHLQQGRQAIPKSVTPARIAENFDVFDFELSADEDEMQGLCMPTTVHGIPAARPSSIAPDSQV